jgi:predicted MPP superfamily phosphohydrolase
LGVYLALVNRSLSYLDGVFKQVFLSSSLILIVGGLGAYGWVCGLSIRALPLAAILAGTALGELRLAFERSKLRAAPPVARSGPRLALRRPVTTTDLRTLHYKVTLPGWGGPKLRITHLSDLHVSRELPIDYYMNVVEEVQRGEPDLIFITGDFISDPESASLLPGILVGLDGKLGTYAILGNHDYWTDPMLVETAVREQGIHMLHNGWEQLSFAGRTIFVLGSERPWNRQRCPAPPIQRDELALGLSHTADNVYQFSRIGVAAVFSGHYHGGQIQIPGFGPLVVPSRYGRRFHQGHFTLNDTHLFVSAGIGVGSPSLRVYCQPDFLSVDFYPGDALEAPTS